THGRYRGSRRHEQGTRRGCLWNGTVGVTRTRGHRAAQTTGFTRMTVVDVLENVDKLADGMAGSVDAVTGAAIGPYRESRLKGGHDATRETNSAPSSTLHPATGGGAGHGRRRPP